MSCSQFIEPDEEDKSDTLVVIVNGDGTVSVDRETLERVLQQQCRAAVSILKFEDDNEPDSQSGRVNIDDHDALFEDRETIGNKVNLVVEGYYPPPPLNMASKNNGSADSVVSSTVATPPLPQSSSDFLDLLSEGLEIPVSNVQNTSSEGCIGDSLVDAFSEMAPEQLKQVETALHSEKAKQILGDDVSTVLDTLKLKEEDDWVHFDHCYTNIYGNRKSSPSPCKVDNVVVQDSEEATYVTIQMGENGIASDTKSAPAETHDNVESATLKEISDEIAEKLEKLEVPEPREEPPKIKKKLITPISTSTPKSESSNDKAAVPKKGAPDITKKLINSSREKRSLHILSKVKRKGASKSEEHPVERIVTEDEVDGVKVFKPTRNDKKLARPFPFSKESGKSILLNRSQLIQTKLNFNKKEGSESVAPTAPLKPPSVFKEKPEGQVTRPEPVIQKIRIASSSENEDPSKVAKKEVPRKPNTPVTPELFGPALFSTPDIIRKINSDEPSKENEKLTPPSESIIVDETADIEKRMSALENGEAILDRIHMQFEMQNKERYSSQSDDDRLLSDLENTDDETSQMDTDVTPSVDTSKKMETVDSNSDLSNVDKSENSDKEDVDYEDDPNKLWCICNKPHGNRFMICCDACDNWYHGSCVGVTRPMGEKMELNGTEWLCPSCRKVKFAKERELKLKSATRGTSNRASGKQSLQNMSNLLSTSSDTSPSVAVAGERPPQITPIRRKSSSQSIRIPQWQLCIECKENEVMLNGIYCSKACIVKQVDAFISSNSSPSDPLPDEQKIIVVDKKRDHRITGMRAPSVANLKEWLMEHPSYEIVRPSAFPMSRPTPPAAKPQQSKPAAQRLGEAAKSSTPISKAHQSGAPGKSKLTLKIKDGSVALDGNAQSSIRQFFGSKTAADSNPSKMKKIEDGSGNIIIREGNVLRTVSSSSSKKDAEFRSKEKQRLIKLIPAQLHKQGEEPKQTVQVVRKVTLATTGAEKVKKRKIEVPIKDKPPLPAKEKSATKKVEIKRQDSKKSLEEGGETSEPTPTASKGPEPVRAKLKKSLSDLFVSRLKDISDLAVPEADVITLATQVEEELFNFFRDTGQKYKNKYRSLVFNLKDQKNNLFRRVADKSLSPHQLVRLTPEELASTELAQWREREAKHEIDMIKKTELENLNSSKVLVVKTHKGELEIEPTTLPPSKTDTLVPDLQPDEIPVQQDRGKTYTSSALSKEQREKASVSAKEKDSASSSSSKTDAGGEKKNRHKKSEHHREKERHKSRKHRHRSSDRDHHRSRSRRRSKSGEKEGGHKSAMTTEKSGGGSSGSSHRSRSSDKGHAGGRGAEKERHQSRGKRKRSRSRSRRKHRSDERPEEGAAAAAGEQQPPSNETASESAFELSEKLPATLVGLEKPTEEEEKIAADLMSSYNAVDVDLSDMEPTSTVTIKTPPYAHSPDTPAYVWKGTISMPELGKIHTLLKEVSGNCEGLDEDLPPIIECVGRIRPEVMWRYISEVKKSGHEILVLRFEVQDESQELSYLSLYSHLSTKNRMGVIGSTCPGIKDFYMMTLAGHSPIPQVLLPLDGPGFEDNRSHMLLGIIVRTRRKKHSAKASSQLARRKADADGASMLPPVVAPVLENDSFTPPHSPTSVFVNNSVTVPIAVANDDDEPYSPEDDEPYSPSALDDTPSTKPSTDLEREMEEIDRKIAEEKQKLQQFESGKVVPEMYSPTRNYRSEPETPSVQLPDDLQQLLNSFSKKRTSESTPAAASGGILQADPIIDAYKSQPAPVEDEEEPPTEILYSSPEIVDLDSPSTPATATSILAKMAEAAAPVEEPKVSRDPRRKPTLAEAFAGPAQVSQPPPPGMEEEFPAAGGATAAPAAPAVAEEAAATLPPMGLAAEPAYAVPLQAAPPFSYTAAAAAVASVPQFAPPGMMAGHPPIYMTATPVFPQPGALPFGPIPAAQMYVPPTVLHHDPSMIPLPMDSGDQANLLKRKATDDMDDDDSEKGRKSDGKSKKNSSYYSTDAKSRRSHSRSPPRHKSSGYESHRRGYQREDGGDYSSSSRYSSSHKHGGNSKGYSSRRSGYWRSGSSEYSTSSGGGGSSSRKYSENRSRRSRSSSREKGSRRS